MGLILANLTVDYFVLISPLILCNAIPDYNIYLYGGILAFVGLLIAISEIQARNSFAYAQKRIVINIFKEPNPRGAFTIFENRRLISLLKKKEDETQEDKA